MNKLYFYNIKGFESDESYLNSYAVMDVEEIKINNKKKQQELKKIDVQTYLP